MTSSAPTFALVVFDLDGTLVDSSKDIHRAVNAALVQLGLPTRRLDEVHAFLGDGARSLIEQALPREAKSRIDEALRLYRTAYREHLVVDTRPYDGIEALLHALPGKKAIATNKSEALARPLVQALGWTGLFDLVLGGDSLPVTKPDGLVLKTLCERLGVPVRRTVMVGDGPQDILAARAAGSRACAVSWGYKSDEAIGCEPDFVVTSARELATLLGVS